MTNRHSMTTKAIIAFASALFKRRHQIVSTNYKQIYAPVKTKEKEQQPKSGNEKEKESHPLIHKTISLQKHKGKVSFSIR